MIKGITVNGKHTFYAFGLRMLKRNIGSAPKDEHLERVPFSNITYNFDELFGKKSYGERKLSYEFEFIERRIEQAEDKVIGLINWLHWDGSLDLYDDYYPNYHFSVREPDVDCTEKHGLYTLKLVFKAAPAMIPNPNKMKYNAANVTIPDVNGDGAVNATDSSMILAAYTNIQSGQPSGLTAEQEKAADANMDGAINAMDSSMVLDFYSKRQQTNGPYAGMSLEAAWAAYLNDYFNTGGEVY
ncbi:dockerin type I domain-containing protein [Ruminococcus flavefaciens]|uniref:dockerin type I domain-containing protein n=1 Tax=Ruminococcus flavefaciens TaxID=1265 RepID=UPI0026EA2AB9|nr:dockerin type I domain-containing protein [Ruminococcus flavefaciens]